MASARSRAEQVERFLRGLEPAGGVQPRRELETDFVRAETIGTLRDFFQRDQSRPLRDVQPFESGADENPVFAGERDDVGNGAERDEVEERTEIEVGGAGKAGFAPVLEDGVGELECQAGRAELGSVFRVPCSVFEQRIYESRGSGRG